jgi:hypothetical protein
MRRPIAGILILSLIAPSIAAAARDCEYDEDCPRRWYCSDDAVCKRLRKRRRSEEPEDVADVQLRRSTGRSYASLILAPASLALAVTSGIFASTSSDDGLRAVLVIYPLLFATAAAVASGATGGHAGVIARSGLEEIAAGSEGNALQISGWVLWGIGAAGFLSTIVTLIFRAGDFDDNDPILPIAIGSFASGAVAAAGGAMLGVDAMLERNELEAAIEARARPDGDDGDTGDEYEEGEEGNLSPFFVPLGLGFAVIF